MKNDAPENFFRRWSRRKAGSEALPSVAPDLVPVPTVSGESRLPALPTLEDVGMLAPDADFSRYLASGLDPVVRRAAMKKLFTDPHFNCMDGLDIYIDDYTKPSPVSAAMLAGLAHARSTLDPKPAWKIELKLEDIYTDMDPSERSEVSALSDNVGNRDDDLTLASASEPAKSPASSPQQIDHDANRQDDAANRSTQDAMHEAFSQPSAQCDRQEFLREIPTPINGH